MRHQCNQKIKYNISLTSLLSSFLINGSMISTKSKIKLFKSIFEKILSTYMSLDSEMTKIRYLTSFSTSLLKQKATFDRLSEKNLNRQGGYTKITLLHNRKGDNSEMAILQIISF